MQIQPLQINDYASVQIRRWKVEIVKDVRKCDMFSHTSDVANGKASYTHQISSVAYNKMHHFGSFGNDSVWIMGISPNQSESHSVTLAEWIGVDEVCNGTTNLNPYGSWDEAIVQGVIKITLRDYLADVRLKNNKVSLNSRARCE